MIDKRKKIISIVKNENKCPLCKNLLEDSKCRNCMVEIEIKVNGIWISWLSGERK